jgi:radical SAM superfamily enzyme YgiQ (UPF0313 family)
MKDILLVTINAKWIHPSLALRLLKANLGDLESRCDILEFALRQPLSEKTEPILAAKPRILGISVSIWNHLATLELLKELREAWDADDGRQGGCRRPVIILGGPEVSYLPDGAQLFGFADYCVRGEGEIAFRELCETILNGGGVFDDSKFYTVDVNAINSGYRLYNDEDISKKLVYVETSRGCPFGCEFCQSAIGGGGGATVSSGGHANRVREFRLEPFFSEMEDLIRRGAKTFKFLDRTFNMNIERSLKIMEFFLYHIDEQIKQNTEPIVVHFEMVPSRFPPDLINTLARFPHGTLRLEIGKIGRASCRERVWS